MIKDHMLVNDVKPYFTKINKSTRKAYIQVVKKNKVEQKSIFHLSSINKLKTECTSSDGKGISQLGKTSRREDRPPFSC